MEVTVKGKDIPYPIQYFEEGNFPAYVLDGIRWVSDDVDDGNSVSYMLENLFAFLIWSQSWSKKSLVTFEHK